MTLAAAKTEQPFDRGLSVATDIEDAFKSVAKRKPPDELEQCCSNVADARNKRDIEFAGDSFVPGTGRIYIKTWGCSHNRSDSEYMAGILAQAGYEITDAATDADLWLLNSCTVKTPSEDQLRALVHGPLSTNKNGVLLNSSIRPPVVLSGCVPQAAPKADWMKGISIVGVQMIDRVVEVVEETLKGNTVRLLGTKRKGGKRLAGADLNLPKIRKNPLIEILAINSGCLNHCTYCKTKQARGDLASYPIDQLVARAQSAFEDGVKEIWLTSEDLGAYGRDLGVTLPDLLDELVKVIPQGCMLRLGMTNPPYIMDHLPEIAAILQHERVYAFLHIPVQSGSDAVLADMKREYTAGQFETVVRFMSEKIPGIHIATDVICAFPTETQDDFQETYDLIDKYRFPSVFINQFYPRPGTPAAKMPLIDTVEARRRTKLLSDLFRSYHPYSGRVGRVYTALITEWASDKKHLVAHNKFYEQILIDPKDNPNGGNLMGATVRVRITSIASKFAMRGKVLVDDDHSMGNAPITIAAAKIATVAQRTKLCCGAAGGWLLPLAVVVLSYWLVAWLLP